MSLRAKGLSGAPRRSDYGLARRKKVECDIDGADQPRKGGESDERAERSMIDHKAENDEAQCDSDKNRPATQIGVRADPVADDRLDEGGVDLTSFSIAVRMAS